MIFPFLDLLKPSMVFSKMIFKKKLYEYFNDKIKPKYSIKKQKEQKKRKQNLRVCTQCCRHNCSNCASRRPKNTNLKKKNAIKVLEILRKVRDNLKELLKVPANMADICKISRY